MKDVIRGQMRTNKLQLLVILIFSSVFQVFAGDNHSVIKTKFGVTPFVQKVSGIGRVIDVIQTRDGNYVSLHSPSNGDSGFTVRKASAGGKKIWERRLTFQVPGYEVYLLSIAEINDGYVLVGGSVGYYGPSSAYVITLRPNGEINWSQQFQINGNLGFHSVNPTPDGGFTIVGGVYPEIYHPILVRFTSSGNILWSKQFETLNFNFYAQSVSDNGLVLASDSYNYDRRLTDVTLVKIDSSGQINWSKKLAINDASVSMGATLDSGIIVASSPAHSRILSLVRLSKDGKIQWKAKYSLGVTSFTVSHLLQTSDGGYAITGTTLDNAGATRSGFFLKIDAQRNVVLQKIFGSSNAFDEGTSTFAMKIGVMSWWDQPGVRPTTKTTCFS
jgi:hypothetical protein